MKVISGAIAAACLGLAASAVSAATIDLNVSKTWTQGTHTYSNGSESVQVEAFLYGSSSLPTVYGNPYLASFSGSAGGLGICSGTIKSGNCSEAHTVDGDGENEMAVLNFGSTIVKLVGITFSYVDKDDKFDLFAFASGIGSAATQGLLDLAISSSCTTGCYVTGFNLAQGSVFGIGAFQKKSEFKIRSITFDVIPDEPPPPPPPPPVPLPAGGWLLLAGLGALAAARKRRKA